jgi:hypothetical protein
MPRNQDAINKSTCDPETMYGLSTPPKHGAQTVLQGKKQKKEMPQMWIEHMTFRSSV